jgi:hypothetical protein
MGGEENRGWGDREDGEEVRRKRRCKTLNSELRTLSPKT